MLASTRYLRHCTRRPLPACTRPGSAAGHRAGLGNRAVQKGAASGWCAHRLDSPSDPTVPAPLPCAHNCPARPRTALTHLVVRLERLEEVGGCLRPGALVHVHFAAALADHAHDAGVGDRGADRQRFLRQPQAGGRAGWVGGRALSSSSAAGGGGGVGRCAPPPQVGG